MVILDEVSIWYDSVKTHLDRKGVVSEIVRSPSNADPSLFIDLFFNVGAISATRVSVNMHELIIESLDIDNKLVSWKQFEGEKLSEEMRRELDLAIKA